MTDGRIDGGVHYMSIEKLGDNKSFGKTRGQQRHWPDCLDLCSSDSNFC